MKMCKMIIMAMMLGLSQYAAPDTPTTDTQHAGDEYGMQAIIRPLEVRTRRLHMVRPDLLRYPIQYDTFC